MSIVQSSASCPGRIFSLVSLCAHSSTCNRRATASGRGRRGARHRDGAAHRSARHDGEVDRASQVDQVLLGEILNQLGSVSVPTAVGAAAALVFLALVVVIAAAVVRVAQNLTPHALESLLVLFVVCIEAEVVELRLHARRAGVGIFGKAVVCASASSDCEQTSRSKSSSSESSCVILSSASTRSSAGITPGCSWNAVRLFEKSCSIVYL